MLLWRCIKWSRRTRWCRYRVLNITTIASQCLAIGLKCLVIHKFQNKSRIRNGTWERVGNTLLNKLCSNSLGIRWHREGFRGAREELWIRKERAMKWRTATQFVEQRISNPPWLSVSVSARVLKIVHHEAVESHGEALGSHCSDAKDSISASSSPIASLDGSP